MGRQAAGEKELMYFCWRLVVMVNIENQIVDAVRGALISCAFAAVSLSAIAQEQAVAELEAVVVTGSRIQRPDYESASPVVSVSSELFEQTGTTTVETLLNSLPQFVPSVTNTSNNPSNGGQANVELRGLGASRTLVLLDGRRIVPSNSTGVVDLNLLPTSLIDSVEVITGGASAVYGSDAVAGVVNFRTKKFSGLQIDGDFGETFEGDGREWTVSVSGGTAFAGDRGHLIGTASYTDRGQVLQSDRELSAIALGYDGTDFVPLGSGTIVEGRASVAASPAALNALFQSYGFPAGRVAGQSNFGFNADGTLFTLGNGTPGSVVNFKGTQGSTFNDAAYTYNFAPPNYLQLPLERKSFFGKASFDVSENTAIYAQALWGDFEANTELAPSPASSLFVPVTNRYVPVGLATLAASRATNPTAPISVSKRVAELGPRFENNKYEVYQVTAGLGGAIGGSTWKYDLSASTGKVTIGNLQLGSVSRTKVAELTFSADGGVAKCGGLNVFGQGSISKACADYIAVDALNKTDVKMTTAELNFNGPLFAMPAGEARGAIGTFYKKDEFNFVADPKLSAVTTGSYFPGFNGRADVSGFNATDNIKGSADSKEIYIETLFPLLANRPGIKKLEFGAGYRYADYSTTGGVNSYKGELVYGPTEAFSIRSSYQRAVRAPNISELFQPQLTNFPSTGLTGNDRDPCNFNSSFRTGANAAQVTALCGAQGIPAAILPTYTYTNSQVEGLTGGNPNLSEESADTMALGVVMRIPSEWRRLSSLQVSIDGYRIKIKNAISSIQASTFLPRCYDAQYNPSLSATNFYCSYFRRDALAGGVVIDALELKENLATIESSGIDMQLDAVVDIGVGKLRTNLVTTYTETHDIKALPGDPFDHYAGTIGDDIAETFPRWKATWNLGYQVGSASATLRWRYVGKVADFFEPTFHLPATHYVDLGTGYGFTDGMFDGLTLRAGLTNAFNRKPRTYPSAVQANTDPSTYDVLGRRYFLTASYKF
jgi:iron complex outermembrane recepter protein